MVPQTWKNAVIQILYNKSLTKYGNYQGISQVARAGTELVKIVERRCGYYIEKKLLPEAHCGFRPGRLTIDIIFAVGWLQELRRKEHVPLYLRAAGPYKVYESDSRTLL